LNASAESQRAAIARRLRQATCFATLVLVALIARWVVYGNISAMKIAAGTILTLPLIVAAPLLYAGHRRTYAWMTLAIVPSLVLAITETVANSAIRMWAALCLFTAFALFVLLIAHLRATRSTSPMSSRT
jgi:uncharacterized membrane protein